MKLSLTCIKLQPGLHRLRDPYFHKIPTIAWRETCLQLAAINPDMRWDHFYELVLLLRTDIVKNKDAE